MSVKHKVKQGEWLAKIIRQYSLGSWQEVWDSPENTALKQKRRNPYCLLPGDEVVIPPPTEMKVSAGASYVLQGGERPDRLRLGLRRANTPLSRRRYELTFGEQVHCGTLSFTGMLEHLLPPEATEARLKIWTREEPELTCEWTLKLGHLDPVQEVSGAQARLANLGYYHGPINNELTDDTRTSLRNYQVALELPPTGELDAATSESLEATHEWNGGTELPEPPPGQAQDAPPPSGEVSELHEEAPQQSGPLPPEPAPVAEPPGTEPATQVAPGPQGTPPPPQSAVPVQTHRYGGFVLRTGDRDDQQRWGGQVQVQVQGNNGTATFVAPANGAAGAALSAPAHVLRLQRDLRELGFLVGGAPDGVFGLGTDWAVREFQVYAKMEHIAQEDTAATNPDYVARLSRAQNSLRYQGPISGIVNDATEQRIRHWLAHRWRCPVIVRAMRVQNNNPTTVIQDNLWRHDDTIDTTARIYVRDFTQYYTLPAGRDADALRVLGSYATYPGYGGQQSLPPRHTWTSSELLPASLVGVATFQAMTPAQQSTYKVVRAASEQECLGFFDSLNAYDNAFVSLGPCHWTLGILFLGQAVPSEGELGGFLSYLRATNAEAFQQAIESFGMRIDEDWNGGAGDGANLYDSTGKKYTGWPAQQRDDSTWGRMARTAAAGNYYKTYHWYYRFQMAGRTIAGFQRAMWGMARIRLRDIRATPWGTGVADVGNGNQTRPATIGDVVTSERGMGILLRWHIFRPGHVAAQNAAGQRLRNAFTVARDANPTLNWNQSPALWGNAHEAALVTAILDEAANVNDTVNAVANWPAWLGGGAQANPRGYALTLPAGTNLRILRGSFQFDAP
ncbi:peptidoglycan-binding domain-containing protein [Corallococcus sicarius]|uniref:Peptidoglycan-binding protein n=1 Tax=Corallococcus sicarius TaxID=2316726 RepID=A0A3A8NPK4_9BACT|nr:peptidoglycan-binding protein [Corallococcus sicarius]RKH46296.1 peptidoglycan-binding protein [Corallococcus sicarius]